MKIRVNMFLDAENVMKWRKQHHNLSEFVNNAIRISLMADGAGVDIQSEREELKRNIDLRNELNITILSQTERIDLLEKALKEKDIEAARELDEAAKKARSCAICGLVVDDPTMLKTFPVGKVCRECMHTADVKVLMRKGADEVPEINLKG